MFQTPTKLEDGPGALDIFLRELYRFTLRQEKKYLQKKISFDGLIEYLNTSKKISLNDLIEYSNTSEKKTSLNNLIEDFMISIYFRIDYRNSLSLISIIKIKYQDLFNQQENDYVTYKKLGKNIKELRRQSSKFLEYLLLHPGNNYDDRVKAWVDDQKEFLNKRSQETYNYKSNNINKLEQFEEWCKEIDAESIADKKYQKLSLLLKLTIVFLEKKFINSKKMTVLILVNERLRKHDRNMNEIDIEAVTALLELMKNDLENKFDRRTINQLVGIMSRINNDYRKEGKIINHARKIRDVLEVLRIILKHKQFNLSGYAPYERLLHELVAAINDRNKGNNDDDITIKKEISNFLINESQAVTNEEYTNNILGNLTKQIKKKHNNIIKEINAPPNIFSTQSSPEDIDDSKKRRVNFTHERHHSYLLPTYWLNKNNNLKKLQEYDSNFKVVDRDITFPTITGDKQFVLVFMEPSILKKNHSCELRSNYIYRGGFKSLTNEQLDYINKHCLYISIEKGKNAKGEMSYIITCPNEFKELTIDIVTKWKDFKQRKQIKEQKRSSSIKIQSDLKLNNTTKNSDENFAATTIQSFYRGYRDHKNYMQYLEKKKELEAAEKELALLQFDLLNRH